MRGPHLCRHVYWKGAVWQRFPTSDSRPIIALIFSSAERLWFSKVGIQIFLRWLPQTTGRSPDELARCLLWAVVGAFLSLGKPPSQIFRRFLAGILLTFLIRERKGALLTLRCQWCGVCMRIPKVVILCQDTPCMKLWIESSQTCTMSREDEYVKVFLKPY